MHIAVDIVLVVALLALIVFPLAARAAAARLPIAPQSAVEPLPPLQQSPGGDVRLVPLSDVEPAEYADRGFAEAAFFEAAAPVLGFDSTDQLIALLRRPEPLVIDIDDGTAGGAPAIGGTDPQEIPYPFHFPPIDEVLDRALPDALSPDDAAALNDAAAVLLRATIQLPVDMTNAPPIAFSLLDRARNATPACEPQVNLAWLVSLDLFPRDDAIADEFATAAERCKDDPTPLWWLGQYRSIYSLRGAELFGNTSHAERVEEALATFAKLQQQFPGSHAGWSGAADTHMRLGYEIEERQPFTARDHYRNALVLYERAMQLDDDPLLIGGAARAQAALGEVDAAVALSEQALAARPDDLTLQVRYVEFLERAHRFADAAAAPIDGGAPIMIRSAIPVLPLTPDPVAAEDAQLPVSWGAAEIGATSVSLSAIGGGAGSALFDLGFLPEYREVYGLTLPDRWCRDWVRRRALFLTGQPGEAVRDFPRTFFSHRSMQRGDCGFGANMLAAVAALQAGDAQQARRWARRSTFGVVVDDYQSDADPELSAVQDQRQNLWRFGGDLDAAQTAAQEWLAASPGSVLASDRLGEIAFLGEQYDDAIEHFAAAADLTFGPEGAIAAAEEKLKQGTAETFAGAPQDGLVLLDEAGALLADIVVRDEDRYYADPDYAEAYDRAIRTAYYSAAQAGDAALRLRDYATAEERYTKARQLQRAFLEVLIEPGAGALRPEVVENNLALVLIKLGEHDRALAAAQAAVDADPANPLFLQTLAFAKQEAGDTGAAVADYQAALKADPALFSAANDLGVLLNASGDTDGAIAALRRAVGAQPDYALGWFNLGVALSGAGASDLLAAQGAFGRAASLDAAFRDQDRQMVLDSDPYFSALDLSRPLPPRWSFAQSYERAPVGVAGVVLILVLVRLAMTLGSEVAADTGGRRLLGRLGRTRWLAGDRRGWAGIAAAATVAVLLWPALRGGGAPLGEAILLAAAGLLLVGLYVRARSRWARRSAVTEQGTSLHHHTWPPSLLLAAISAGVGLGFAPLPVTDQHDEVPRLQWVGPVVLVTIAVLLLVLGRMTEVPFTRAAGAAGLMITGSLLLPVPPYDGAALSNRAALTFDILLLGLAALLFFGIL